MRRVCAVFLLAVTSTTPAQLTTPDGHELVLVRADQLGVLLKRVVEQEDALRRLRADVGCV